MRHWLVLAVLLLGAASASAADLKITAFTSANGYIKKFPINTATQRDLIESLGTPDRALEFEGKLLWSYDYGEPGLIRTYTFTIDNSIVTRVEYLGPLGSKKSSD